MQTTSFVQTILKADAGNWLYNEKDNTFAHTAYLGRDATAEDWREVSEGERAEILAAQAAKEAEEAET